MTCDAAGAGRVRVSGPLSPVRSEPESESEDDQRSVLADTGTGEDTLTVCHCLLSAAKTRNKIQTKSRWGAEVLNLEQQDIEKLDEV